MELEQLSLPPRTKRSQLTLPLAGACIAAGFPSPADDYIEVGIDLNEHLIRNPSSTFFLKVSGHSMTGAGVQDGDLLIVDRSLEARPGCIVVAILDGEFTLKRLTRVNNIFYLEADHPSYPPLNLREYNNVQIWGVAVYSIHHLKPSRP